MLHHATRRADITSTPLLSILQAAAGRAWVRTRPVRAFHRAVPTVTFAQAERKDGESSRGLVAQWASGLR
ncbi:uncharacterized protein PHACADRAFT_247741 [Phanerochaete carnosa HHB-10118-sp]|uniref:Uncharacterized protein n=1 Tax=Phanerochaete carnosa (strain HHB-10118-sp) TaxID=650164 RepID=K5WBB9_PHACS|nr:uncharacterized protein PHACADRAFT_247741 [Phanerochaete carnosa HHB-10118-sp]EKM61253.1 hypothetical protein PHACADRAFT_247741 [Phanerochaete carnosa HHB-10118-sp]